MGEGMKRLARILEKTALLAGAALFAGLAAAGFFVTAHLSKQSWSHEAIVFTQDSLMANALLVLLMTAGALLVLRGIARFSGVKLGAGLLGAWCALTLMLVIGANVVQMYDFAYVIEGAELFARGNYKPLEIDYFNVYSYQLGICLPMEIVKRVLPGLNLSLFMQGLNVFLSAGIAAALCVLSRVLFGEKEAKATLLLFVLFLPMALECIFVYGTLPMLLMASLAVLCFALYLKKRKTRFGLGYVLCIAAAYMLKPNAAVPLIALTICAVLDAMESRDWKLLIYAAVSVALSVLLLRAVIMQYELRAGVKLTGDVSMLARLVMGLQRGGAEAGWFNRYTERFFPFDVTAQQEFEIASADLAARLREMKADPAMALAFFRDKLLSQWLEPSYGAMWYGDLCEHTGRLGGMTKALFLDGGAVRRMLEGYMAVFQKMLYFLFAVGLCGLVREKKAAGAALALVLSAIGGCLYHMIFEAKAQYLYMYIVLMMPVAAKGLCIISNWHGRGGNHR
ncbi:MAG: hypothetical protein IJ418_12990 [Clostridia bacterium]|nr:hypothetical protein [Clostridia bacterium]